MKAKIVKKESTKSVCFFCHSNAGSSIITVRNMTKEWVDFCGHGIAPKDSIRVGICFPCLAKANAENN